MAGGNPTVLIYPEGDPYGGWWMELATDESVNDQFEVPRYSVASKKFGAGRSVLTGTEMTITGVLTKWSFGAAQDPEDPVESVEALRQVADDSRMLIVESTWSPGLGWYVSGIEAGVTGDNDGKTVSITLVRALEAQVTWTTTTLKARARPGRKKKKKPGQIGSKMTPEQVQVVWKKKCESGALGIAAQWAGCG